MFIRPQRQQQERHKQLLGSLQRGDRVVTSGGIVGEVVHLKDDEVTMKSGESRFVVLRAGKSQPLSPNPGKVTGFALNAGDRVVVLTAGGGGYGDPLEREPESVMEDLKKSIISDWTAQEIYKIGYDVERRKVDLEKTKQLRQAEKKARLARGLPFANFQEEWSKKTPPKEALQYYGTWPDAKPTGPVFRP